MHSVNGRNIDDLLHSPAASFGECFGFATVIMITISPTGINKHMTAKCRKKPVHNAYLHT